MAYVIKILLFFFFFGKIHLFQTALKNLPNKYLNFGQLLLSSVVNIDELFYKQATSYSLFEPSQTPLDQSEPNLITIGSSYWGSTVIGPRGNSASMSRRMAKSTKWPARQPSLIRLHCPHVETLNP